MTIVLEKMEDGYGAWLSDCPEAFSGIHTIAASKEQITDNVKMLMRDFIENDFKGDPKFVDFNPDEVVFHFQYSLMDFFDSFSAIKINSIAKLAGLNPSLVRQYASGAANASAAQAKKIEEAVRALAQSLLHVSII